MSVFSCQAHQGLELMVQGTQNYKQVRTARFVLPIPYVLFVICIALDVGYVLRGPCPPLYSSGIGLHVNTTKRVLLHVYQVVFLYSTNSTLVRVVT